MKLCRFQSANGIHFGELRDGWLYDLTGVDPVEFRDLESAYTMAGSDVSVMVSRIEDGAKKARKTRFEERLLRIPVESPEIWGAGVTYLRSRQARETETKSKGIYDRVYDAVRPEIFVKDTGLRCRGPGEEICVRSDSKWSVPEPELTVVFDEETRVVGYTVGNDVSSRDIEGENPLYLAQAKVYRGSSAIGPVVTTADEVPEPQKLEIKMRIARDGKVAFKGAVNTSQMKRSIPELADYLGRDNVLRRFTLLMTGTSIVPPDDFTLKGGDEVEIEIEGLGTLRNPVVALR
ncbi:MAG: fumarylacetoacetate hydrolase family protein [Nitrososphaerales archaeon]